MRQRTHVFHAIEANVLRQGDDRRSVNSFIPVFPIHDARNTYSLASVFSRFRQTLPQRLKMHLKSIFDDRQVVEGCLMQEPLQVMWKRFLPELRLLCRWVADLVRTCCIKCHVFCADAFIEQHRVRRDRVVNVMVALQLAAVEAQFHHPPAVGFGKAVHSHRPCYSHTMHADEDVCIARRMIRSNDAARSTARRLGRRASATCWCLRAGSLSRGLASDVRTCRFAPPHTSSNSLGETSAQHQGLVAAALARPRRTLATPTTAAATHAVGTGIRRDKRNGERHQQRELRHGGPPGDHPSRIVGDPAARQ